MTGCVGVTLVVTQKLKQPKYTTCPHTPHPHKNYIGVNMILDNKTQEKPEINYPAKWGFKVIGKDKTKVQQAVKEIMGEKEHTCKFSNSTTKGNYHSYSAECTVESEEERDNLYKAFGKHDDVHYVI